MAGEKVQHTATYRVNQSGGVTANQWVIRDTTNENKCKNPGASNVRGLGITLEAASDDRDVAVALSGTVYCKVASAVAIDDELYIADTSGRVDNVPTSPTNVEYNVVGRAESAGSAANDLILMQILHYQTNT